MAKCKLPISLLDADGKEHQIQPFEPHVFIKDVDDYERQLAAIETPARDAGALGKVRQDFIAAQKDRPVTIDDLARYDVAVAAALAVPNKNARVLEVRLDFIRKVLKHVPDAPKDMQLRAGDVQVVFLAIWKACFQVPDVPLG